MNAKDECKECMLNLYMQRMNALNDCKKWMQLMYSMNEYNEWIP